MPPAIASHILIVSSSDPEATSLLSLEKATDSTAVLWPVSISSFLPVLASHMITALSYDPDATSALLAENATDVMSFVWPLQVEIKEIWGDSGVISGQCNALGSGPPHVRPSPFTNRPARPYYPSDTCCRSLETRRALCRQATHWGFS